MKKVRINDLARELGVRSRKILEILPEAGVVARKSHSSSLGEHEAEKVRVLFPQIGKPINLVQRVPIVSRSLPQSHTPMISVPRRKDTPDIRQSLIDKGVITPSAKLSGEKRLVIPSLRPKVIEKLIDIPLAKEQAIDRSGKLTRPPLHYPGDKRHGEKINLPIRTKKAHQRNPYHLRKSNLTTTPYSLPLRVLPVQESRIRPEAKPIVCCIKCRARVYQDALELHFKNCHGNEHDQQNPNLPATRFPFELLPPGNGEFRTVFEHYRKRSQSVFFEHNFNWDRIDQIELLKPKSRHIGTKAWFGYAAYEFSYSDRVVLESPIEGNAAYVLSGDWTKMICLNKAELRQEYVNRFTKIVHKGNWRYRVHRALRNS